MNMHIRYPFYVISGDAIFVTDENYITALEATRFWDQNELNAWIVANIGRLQSNVVEPLPDYSPLGILRAIWKAVRW